MIADKMTAREAAVFLDVTPGRIRQLAVEGVLEAQKFGPILTFQIDDITSYRERMRARTGKRPGPKPRRNK